jgi:hypothetical protein
VALTYSLGDLPAAAREAVTIEFESEQAGDRVRAALAFGATAAELLRPAVTVTRQDAAVELLCATFNLGIGLVDGLCDRPAESGLALLELIGSEDLAGALEAPRTRGWLGRRLGPDLAADAAVTFTVDVIETFLLNTHAVHAGRAGLALRREVAGQLAAALDAERRSVRGTAGRGSRAALVECSRLTSVLPFQIIERLTGAAHAGRSSSPGTLLGEAMWRIDDLVDLCADARSGALNAVLLGSEEAVALLGEGHRGGDMSRELIAAFDIGGAAAAAGASLRCGLHDALAGRAPADAELAGDAFLHFIQAYTGIGAGEA